MDQPRMLIVDDEASIREALVRWFVLNGFEVESASDGRLAVDICRERDFDVVTMDLEMPRMNGIEAIQEIRKLGKTTPIIVLTGFPRDTERALEHGATKVLMKPLPLRALEKEIRDVLAQA